MGRYARCKLILSMHRSDRRNELSEDVFRRLAIAIAASFALRLLGTGRCAARVIDMLGFLAAYTLGPVLCGIDLDFVESMLRHLAGQSL